MIVSMRLTLVTVDIARSENQRRRSLQKMPGDFIYREKVGVWCWTRHRGYEVVVGGTGTGFSAVSAPLH
jgi:hypothetical protein